MITLALIGVGAWGKKHLKTLKEIPHCQLKYICATSQKTLEALPSSYIKVSNYQELYKYKNINGIIIATPSSTHYRIAKDFLKRGYNLLIEKPVALSYQETLELKRVSEQKKACVLAGHLFQYHPAYLKIKELLKKIGKIQYLDFEGVDLGPFRNDTSALWDWGPHDVTMCLELVGKMPLEVSAWMVNKLRPKTQWYDLVYLRLVFPDDIFAFLKMGWLSPIKKRKIIIVGSLSSLIFDDTVSRKITFLQNLGPQVEGTEVVKIKPRIFYPSYSQEMPLKLELLEFVRCLKEKKNPKTDLSQALRTAKVIHFAQESILQGGKPVKVKDSP